MGIGRYQWRDQQTADGIHGARKGAVPVEGDSIWASFCAGHIPAGGGPGHLSRDDAPCLRLSGRHHRHRQNAAGAMDNLREVFRRLRASNLKINIDKCDFFKKELKYL
ncbi:hypothetical protein AWZ03_015327, partial [Drosophila navojoa]